MHHSNDADHQNRSHFESHCKLRQNIMKPSTPCFSLSIGLAAGLALATSALADTPLVTVTTFDNVNTSPPFGPPYGSWTPASINAGPTSFDVHATGFGGVYDPLS